MTGLDDQGLREALARLKQAHRTLDEDIKRAEAEGGVDQLMLSRLKKRKLTLKDEIARLEDKLVPDIIA
ncbi:MAG: DUF465 domain-containing protein [Hyphomicrobiales bacterium]|nr:DUF465 domain-containing protein [Hyphomicrobiales bacterium]